MDKKWPETSEGKQAETVDASRRKLLGQMGKAAYVAPTLTFLSLTVKADGPPVLSGCPPELPCPSSNKSTTTSNRKPKHRNDRG